MLANACGLQWTQIFLLMTWECCSGHQHSWANIHSGSICQEIVRILSYYTHLCFSILIEGMLLDNSLPLDFFFLQAFLQKCGIWTKELTDPPWAVKSYCCSAQSSVSSALLDGSSVTMRWQRGKMAWLLVLKCQPAFGAFKLFIYFPPLHQCLFTRNPLKSSFVLFILPQTLWFLFRRAVQALPWLLCLRNSWNPSV